MVPEMKFLEEQLTEKLMPLLGYPELRVEFDLSAIEATRQDENSLDRGGVDRQRGPPAAQPPRRSWGDAPLGPAEGEA